MGSGPYKLKVLRSLKPIDDANVNQVTVRGQYRAGAMASGPVPGYREEVGNPASNVRSTEASV